MKYRRRLAMDKVYNAINEHGGTTLLSTGMTADDCRLAKAVVDSGVKLLEANHSSVALRDGCRGITTMMEAEFVRYEVSVETMGNVVRGLRNVLGNEVFITVGALGTFQEPVYFPFQEEHAEILSYAGADGLHVHKIDLEDLRQITEIAHKYGLTIDSYIASPEDVPIAGIPASTPDEVKEVAKSMEDMGVDMIGLMTKQAYKGTKGMDIAPATLERLKALMSSVKTPTIAEAGINLQNFHKFRELGVSIIVVGTAMDNMAAEAAVNAAKQFIGKS